jgi:glycosyltransferase involved in cell wall biosynthesis
VHFTGAVAYADVPAHLKWARVGVAPYQPSRLGQMQLGFFWSPLKIFEYMAMGLPVVSIDVEPLRDVIRASEGRLVAEGDVDALADAIVRIAGDRSGAEAMGRSARERVVAEFSWQRHCEQLERILEALR